MNNELIERIDAAILGGQDEIVFLREHDFDCHEIFKMISVLQDCKAALSQREAEPVAPSQDVDEFIYTHGNSASQFGDTRDVVPVDALTAWMAGHARVPVEPTYEDMQSMIDAGIKSTSAKVTRNECLMIYAAMLTRQCNLLTASKERAE